MNVNRQRSKCSEARAVKPQQELVMNNQKRPLSFVLLTAVCATRRGDAEEVTQCVRLPFSAS
jgi:hypothetical protein